MSFSISWEIKLFVEEFVILFISSVIIWIFWPFFWEGELQLILNLLISAQLFCAKYIVYVIESMYTVFFCFFLLPARHGKECVIIKMLWSLFWKQLYFCVLIVKRIFVFVFLDHSPKTMGGSLLRRGRIHPLFKLGSVRGGPKKNS